MMLELLPLGFSDFGFRIGLAGLRGPLWDVPLILTVLHREFSYLQF